MGGGVSGVTRRRAAASQTRMCHAARGELRQSLPRNTKGAGREVGGHKEEALQDRWNHQPTILSPGRGEGDVTGASSFFFPLSLSLCCAQRSRGIVVGGRGGVGGGTFPVGSRLKSAASRNRSE